ncbi:xanthine dehydrogenase family protein molybdopterin-binding subunit [Adhaeribacter radiodurans]|uniref:Xanthine dehydrogenase family protein molybdopterin-binding subunit n=1 Tax=Adhaeribacter radiodurans TaxID=2745197 RepID=A0A7L7LAH1_9BACT|nr:xanthine dehydrogenase family protein molybdopterin-binding subunit [Adhaeribacter radiodurans]QMU29545.1 xanthine dehydrogenase family protein molybdopterin-binding subunit [Adhaeribacter radiodurans]
MDNVENTVSRRKFLKSAGLSGAFLALGFSLPNVGNAATLKKLASPAVLDLEFSPFILIDTAGKITLFNARPEMGQGTFQAMPALLAEELEVSLDQVSILPTDGRKKYGFQLSGGSSSVRTSWEPLRKAGAAVREMLVKAAAQHWQVNEADCYAENAAVYHKSSGKKLTYAELVEEASKLEVPKEPKLKDPKDFKILGKSALRPDIPAKVDGSAQFGMDVKVPGMLYASIERAPFIFGKVTNLEDANAKAIAGVKHVVVSERKMPHRSTQGVAVIADTYFAALKGRKALKVSWEPETASELSTTEYFNRLRQLSKNEGAEFLQKGNVNEGLTAAFKKIEAHYETPFLAHAPMEPENATAHVTEGACEIWAPVQAPDLAAAQVAEYLNISPENVKVHVPFLGGAFGRKAYFDYLLEAVNLSKQVKAPVKLIWTREDDTIQGPFRPGMLSAMRGGIDKNGQVIAFEHKVVGSSIVHQTQAFGGKKLKENEADEWTMESINPTDSPYKFTNAGYRFVLAETEIPIVWWRSVYSSTSAFGQESFVDELAHAAGKDPLTFRLNLLNESPRFANVLKLLGEKAKWNEKLPAGKARGIAIARSFGSICAHAVTVAKDKNGVKIEKVVSVIDCGQVVNPNTVKAQTEGNVIMGLTAAIKDGITLENGRVQQSNFHQYRVMRINETPVIEVHIMPSTEAPGGVGEPGLPPVAPALCNAVFALTGKRVRKLPFDLTNLSKV